MTVSTAHPHVVPYRREIDGLRAVAVIPVILFHAGVRWFSGGYVGVDVFFVISGYLITTLIVTELRAGTFSLGSFYERRARRILPALFVVGLASLIVAWYTLPPVQLVEFGKSLIAIPTFTSNLFFYSVSGYFDTTAELKPLLHTWSLAVEEQYYAVFPLFVLLVWTLRRRWLPAACAVLLAVSLLLAQAGANVHWLSPQKLDAHWDWWATPPYGFYLLPTRGWELLMGGLTALFLLSRRDHGAVDRGSEYGSLIGLGLIVYAVYTFDTGTPFPSIYALIPTTGAALLILCATPRTMVGRSLGSRTLVAIGLMSYSLYLWHQPLLVFARVGSAYEPDGTLLAGLVIVTVGLAFLTWRYVEVPCRDRTQIHRRTLLMSMATLAMLMIGAGIVLTRADGFPGRYLARAGETLSASEEALLEFKVYDVRKPYRQRSCFLVQDQSYVEFGRTCGASEGASVDVLVWGDSYAAAMSSGFHDLIPDRFAQYTSAGCPPVIDVSAPSNPYCRDVNTSVLGQVQRLQPRAVVVHAHWQAYQTMNVLPKLGGTIRQIKQVSPGSSVYVVGNIPHWDPSLPLYLVKRHIGLNREASLFNPRLPNLRPLDESLRSIARGSGASFISALDVLCSEGRCPVVSKVNDTFEPTAWDNAHLTRAGSLLLAQKLLPLVVAK